jgi:phage tail sheath gpL-like
MPISFSNIPANWRMPLYWVEVDPSMAGLPIIRQPALLVGCMLPTGTAQVDVPKVIGTQASADKEFGEGSELANMFRAFFANNFAHEVWGLPVAQLPGATAAIGTLEIKTPPTEAGTVHLYVAGHHVPTNIGPSDTAAMVASAITDSINDDKDLPVTAEVGTVAPDDVIVTLTAKNTGILGNDIDMRLNFYGRLGGQETPPGLTYEFQGDPDLTSAKLSGGNGVPDFANAIANIQTIEYEYVALPYTDSQTLFDWNQEYGFADHGRWGWMRQQFGHIFCAKRGDLSDLVNWGMDPQVNMNSGLISVMGWEVEAPSPVYEVCCAYAAKAARALTNDPARPLQTLSLNKILPARADERFIMSELNTLSGRGIATQKTGSDGQPMIMRETTTYQLNLYSQSDDAYELVTTLATLARLLRNQRHAITTKFPRHKLANDGTRFGVGQAIVTPKIIQAELVSQYRIDEFNGLVEDVASFKQHLIVERDPNDPNRVNVLYPPDLVNQLRVFAVLAQFRLQYNRGQDLEIIGNFGAGAFQATGNI